MYSQGPQQSKEERHMSHICEEQSPNVEVEVEVEVEVALQPYDNSLSFFCQFIDRYTRLSSDPVYTAAVCLNQAEVVRITPQDISPETIAMLVETMLSVINNLEDKWLTERMQREDLERRKLPFVAKRFFIKAHKLFT
jgi:hypothetical protein